MTDLHAAIAAARRGIATLAIARDGSEARLLALESVARDMRDLLRALDAAQGEPVAEPPRYQTTRGHCPNKSAGSRDCGLHNLHCNWPKCDERVTLLNPTPIPAAPQAPPAAVPAGWQEQLADSLECFWNEALGAERNGCLPVGAIAVGIQAIAGRLREHAMLAAANKENGND